MFTNLNEFRLPVQDANVKKITAYRDFRVLGLSYGKPATKIQLIFDYIKPTCVSPNFSAVSALFNPVKSP